MTQKSSRFSKFSAISWEQQRHGWQMAQKQLQVGFNIWTSKQGHNVTHIGALSTKGRSAVYSNELSTPSTRFAKCQIFFNVKKVVKIKELGIDIKWREREVFLYLCTKRSFCIDVHISIIVITIWQWSFAQFFTLSDYIKWVNTSLTDGKLLSYLGESLLCLQCDEQRHIGKHEQEHWQLQSRAADFQKLIFAVFFTSNYFNL